MTLNIQSPIVAGTGVEVVHQTLEKHIPNYHCALVNPLKASYPLFVHNKNCNAQIIHTIPDMGVKYFSKLAKNIITFHGYSVDEQFIDNQSSFIRKAYYRWILRPRIIRACNEADELTAVSHYLAELVKRDLNLNRNIHVIYNGINTDLFSPTHNEVSKDKLKVLYVGKLNDRKGYDIVDKLAYELKDRISFLVLGKGSVKPNPHITYLPRTTHNNMPAVYNNADVVLLPSSREGFSLVLAEAMACGRAVISSNTAAIPELVHQGKGGFLCPVGDVDAFREALVTLVDQRHLVTAFGQYNRERVTKHFSATQMAQAYQSLFYQSVAR